MPYFYSFKSAGVLCALSLYLAACAPVPVQEQPPAEVQQAEAPKPEIKPVKKPVVKPHVAIVLSSETPFYTDVADALMPRLQGRGSRFTLSSNPVDNQVILDQIASDQYGQVVTLGAAATEMCKTLERKQMVFSQVFNPLGQKLVSHSIKGVDMLPAVEPLFKEWSALSPGLHRVLLVTGEGLRYYIIPAKRAAKKYGIELVHKTVSFDKEFLFESKSTEDIQGQWIIPDHRVLSSDILKEILSYNAREGRQTVVFNDNLLEYGGLMSVQPDPRDISRLVNSYLNRAIGEDHIPGPDLLAVTRNVTRINTLIANQLGIESP